jgi:hypothetical protein
MTQSKLAIVIPFRENRPQLHELLHHLQWFLRQRPHEIYVIEQKDGKPFNRAKLMNAGFHLLSSDHRHFVFHDVDQFALDADYSGVNHVAQLAGDFSWGRSTLFSRESFSKINGASNEYWGEPYFDGEMQSRCEFHGLSVEYRRGNFISTATPNAAPTETRMFCPKRAARDGLANLQFRAGDRLEAKSHSTRLQMSTVRFKKPVYFLPVWL